MSEITLRHDGKKTFFVAFPKPTNARYVVKEAGFRFDGGKSRWTTSSLDDVSALLKSNPDVTAEAAAAIEALKSAMAERKERAAVSVVASSATDASIDIPAPEGLTYLPYQKAGIAYALGRDGVLIADDMGLGKTIQAIGVVNADPSARRVLVVCPAGLKLNWLGEFRKWDVKGLTVAVAKSGKALPAAEVVIVNFEIVSKLRAAIDAVAWDVLIVDEAHYAKNPKAQRTVAILGGSKAKVEPIQARRRVFLTGTPIVNRPSELWPIVKCLDPQGLGDMGWFGFARRYCDGHDTRFGFEADGATNLAELQVKLRSSIMVRRLKADVLTELPAKRRQLLPIEANADIKRVIRAMEQSEAETKAKIAALRKTAKATAPGSDEYKALSQAIRNTAQVGFEEMSAHRHALAVAKAPLVVEHVREILEAEESVVVAVYHLDVVDILVEGLKDLGVRLITGKQTLEERQAAKDDFQAGKGRVVIGTIGAMAEGWTLTRASTMVFGELDWTPGKVTQTEDRIHRIGQQNSVLIQHLVVDETLDATFVQKLVAKQEVITAAMDGGMMEDKEALAAELFDVADVVDVEATTTEEEADEAFAAAEAEIETLKAEREKVSADRRVEYDRQMSQRQAAIQAEKEARHGKRMALLDDATPDAIEAAYEALRIVAGMDKDHAQEQNDIGFSQAHTRQGHRLAGLDASRRTRLDDASALWIARIFRGQVPEALQSRLTAKLTAKVPVTIADGAVASAVIEASVIHLSDVRTGEVVYLAGEWSRDFVDSIDDGSINSEMILAA